MSKDKTTVTPTKKKRVDTKQFKRLMFIFMFSGNIAVSVYLAILVANPDMGQYILAGFSALSAVYFLNQAIK